MDSITVTERAAQRIGEILRREPVGTMLRVSVEGGGCSGFQYKFDMDSAQGADDLVIQRGAATVLIDQTSVGYLAGSEIDFVEELVGSSFAIFSTVVVLKPRSNARRRSRASRAACSRRRYSARAA